MNSWRFIRCRNSTLSAERSGRHIELSNGSRAHQNRDGLWIRRPFRQTTRGSNSMWQTEIVANSSQNVHHAQIRRGVLHCDANGMPPKLRSHCRRVPQE